MNEDVPSMQGRRASGRPGSVKAPASRGAARSMLAARRALRGTLPAALIHDPALDMLLILYLAQPASIASDWLVARTTIAPNVAAHWIEALRGEGLVTRAEGEVTLSEEGTDAVERMIEAVVRSQQAFAADDR